VSPPGLALDLGTASTRVFRQGEGIVFDEPSVAAVDMDNGTLISYGTAAARMAGRSAGRVSIVRPFGHGYLVDLELAEAVIANLLRAVGAPRLRHPPVVVSVPGEATHVQRRAVEWALRRGGAGKALLVEHQLASAMGARLPIHEAAGSIIVDIGAGTTEIGVLSLGAMAAAASVPIGGGDIDDAIRDHCARELDLLLDRATAEQVKIHVASAWGPDEEIKAEVLGRDIRNGSVRTVVLSRAELFDTVDERLQPVLSRIVAAIRAAPPDLANDLLGRGLHLCGGGSRLSGLAQRLAAETGLRVHEIENPELCSVMGAARCIGSMRALGPALSSARPSRAHSARR
jgi:rod shape-determining protein MreB